ncbi:MAG: hypothetical protein IT260_06660 [Saprospiraceae bacterium]|nr:hypothetical protein [Saprospiraceae bacterium]
MQTYRSFLEDIVDESIEMLPMEPAQFDSFLYQGWRLLGYSVIRHNFAICRGRICRTIPLRIRLDAPLNFSKSQRQLLRRNSDLKYRCAPIQLTPEKEQLFLKHTERFRDRQPLSVYSFLNPHSYEIPVSGMEFSIYEQGKLIACSYFHIGETAISATYCFFDPASDRRSLGTYTMLLELQLAQQFGKQYYYHGYCYDVPSQFDYKLNFNNIEVMDWKTGAWSPQPRVPVRKWESLVKEEGEKM